MPSRRRSIERWNKWRKETWEPCPVKSHDKSLCRMAICPCRRFKRYEMDEWFEQRMNFWARMELPGRFGALMKLSRWFRERDASNS